MQPLFIFFNLRLYSEMQKVTLSFHSTKLVAICQVLFAFFSSFWNFVSLGEKIKTDPSLSKKDSKRARKPRPYICMEPFPQKKGTACRAPTTISLLLSVKLFRTVFQTLLKLPNHIGRFRFIATGDGRYNIVMLSSGVAHNSCGVRVREIDGAVEGY
jgi:hypothetical protein